MGIKVILVNCMIVLRNSFGYDVFLLVSEFDCLFEVFVNLFWDC